MQAVFALIIAALAGGTLAGSYCQLLRDILRQTPESFGITKDLPVEARSQLLSQWDESTRMARVSSPPHVQAPRLLHGTIVKSIQAHHHCTCHLSHVNILYLLFTHSSVSSSHDLRCYWMPLPCSLTWARWLPPLPLASWVSGHPQPPCGSHPLDARVMTCLHCHRSNC